MKPQSEKNLILNVIQKWLLAITLEEYVDSGPFFDL